MFKKVGIVSLMFTLVWLVSACGGGEQQPQPAPQSEAPATAKPAALKGDPGKGKTLFVQSCSACHGQDARGLKGLGKDLVASEFVKQKTDQELLDYVKMGRPVNDPLNTTGIPMPPKGGNPALSDQNIMDIIAYLRTIHE